jgi:GNAT superfamily N-acetyltransferase
VALVAAGLVVLKGSERLMTIDLRAHPVATAPDGYRVSVTREGGVLTAVARDEAGQIGAHGTMGISGDDAVADRIETGPAHRRRGLARAVMGALASAAGVTHGLLIASEDGQHLYAALGWRPVAAVLIAARPGTVYPG